MYMRTFQINITKAVRALKGLTLILATSVSSLGLINCLILSQLCSMHKFDKRGNEHMALSSI